MHTSRMEVHLPTIAANFSRIRSLTSPARVWAVVKGDGYGLGLDAVVSALLGAGADCFVVQNAVEAMRLRSIGVRGSVLCLTAEGPQEFDLLIGSEISINVLNLEQLALIAERARSCPNPALLHIEIDTGLGRGGLLPAEVPAALSAVSREERLLLKGVWTHLVQPSSPETSNRQLAAFMNATSFLPRQVERHVANSRGVMLGRAFHLDGVRIGRALYGLLPGFGTVTCFTWESSVAAVLNRPKGFQLGYGSVWTLVRDSVLGIVRVGFADGYPRVATGVVAVRGKLARILGPVSMGTMVVDLTDVPGAAAGDEVLLVGEPEPNIATLVSESEPRTISNLFACVRAASTCREYSYDTRRPEDGH